MSRDPRIRGIRRLFRLPGTRESVRRDIDDEIRFHIEARAAGLIAQGIAPEAAQWQAEREFGDAGAAREELARIDYRRVSRETRAGWRDAGWRDLRFSVRGFRRQPAFTGVIVLTLALGIGANATMFGLVDRLLLRPPARLVDAARTGRIYVARSQRDGTERIDRNINYLRYTELRDETRSFDEMAAFFDIQQVVGLGERARQLTISMASASFWRLFDAPPVIGRTFSAREDSTPAGVPVVVLGHAFWRSEYGGRPDALGEQLQIGGRAYTIIGVAPPGFNGMSLTTIAGYIPIVAGASDVIGDDFYRNYNASWLEIIGRRRADVALDDASEDLGRVYRQSLSRQIAASSGESSVPAALERLKPRAILGSILYDRGPQRGTDARVATWVLGVAVIVLLVACANVANLLLARGLARRREIAVRLALGVGRRRLATQLFIESALLALAGGAAGLVVAQVGGGIVRAVLIPNVEWGNTLLDARLLAFGAGLAALSAVLTGLVPAIQASDPDIADALKSGGREGSHHRSRVRTGLLIVQGAFSVLLLVGAGLFVRSLYNVRSVELGLDIDRVLYVRTDPRGTPMPPATRTELRRRLAERARALPSVEGTASTMTVPFWRSINEDLFVPGIDSVNTLGDFFLNAVSGDYFTTTGTRIVRGRGIQDGDGRGAAPVVVVSRSMAQLLWRTDDALGKCVKVGADTAPCRTVVGIAQDMRWGTFDDSRPLQFYLSDQQYRASDGLYVRTRGDARDAAPAIRRELQRLVPGIAYVEAHPLQDIIDPQLRPWRLGATMFTVFGLLALVLAGIGLYSAIAYGVAQRRHEIGVRLALGAQTPTIARMVVREGLQVVAIGLVIGVVLSLAGSRYITSMLFGVSARDPLTVVVVTVTLLVVAILATLIPAWRASRVDPVTALRAD